MPDPARPRTLQQAVEQARAEGHIPLGLLLYRVKEDQLRLQTVEEIPVNEISAILQKFEITFTVVNR